MRISNKDFEEILENFDLYFKGKPQKIKQLNQGERKLILKAKKNFNHCHGEADKKTDYLMGRIKIKAFKDPEVKNYSFILSFFKGLANIFFCRISSRKLLKIN